MTAVCVPLLAAGIDWVELVLPVLFVIFWLVSQIVAAIRNVAVGPNDAGGRVGRPPRPPQRPVDPALAGEPRGPGLPTGGEDDARRQLGLQIEEFLRDQEHKRGRPPRAAAPAPPAGRDGTRRRESAGRDGQRERPVAPRGGAVAKPVRAPVTAAAAATRPALGSLGTASPELSRHVEDVFGHGLAHLASPLGEAAAAADATAVRSSQRVTELVALVRDPATLRRLVLLREVLDRPVDRW